MNNENIDLPNNMEYKQILLLLSHREEILISKVAKKKTG